MSTIGFDKISPTPGYPAGVSPILLSTFRWESRAIIVQTFKQAIKRDLRKVQKGMCCFCRRHLFDDYATHIEHFIEKKEHPEFTFEIRNLALSCGTCNGVKNGYNLALSSARAKRATRHYTIAVVRCPTLSVSLGPGAKFPLGPASYRWVHPHFDDYSKNIQIEKGWIFRGTSRKGLRTIQKVKLNAISQIERRALHERMSARGGRLSLLVGAMAELNRHRASEVAMLVVEKLRRRRAGNSP